MKSTLCPQLTTFRRDGCWLLRVGRVVLVAFGCGAFRNDPNVVAAAAKTVIADYLHAFRVIEFAVYCRPGDTANYDAFEDALKVIRKI